MRQSVKRLLRPALTAFYHFLLLVLRPANLLLAWLLKDIKHPKSVLHVSHMVHIPYYTTRILRRHGWKADFLAIGNSPTWNKSDYVKPGNWRIDLLFREFLLLWTVVAKYEVLHLHFMITMTATGWELEFLKRMGRKIIVHYRGCEIRDRDLNMSLHPEINICQQCDYNATICQHPINLKRRKLAQIYGDRILVTTPDMKDFIECAEHFSFFAPEADQLPASDTSIRLHRPGTTFRIVHVTNHPGIEGTQHIHNVIGELKSLGYPIEFTFLSGASHDAVLQAHRDADLAIGKMKMGYYANAQIESMAMGVPTITHIRPEFLNSEILESGFILSTLPELQDTLEYYITHPEALAAKRRVARESILKLHNNDHLAQKLINLYEEKSQADPCMYS